MKIVSLRAENIKRLKAVEIRPDGNMVEITGRNAQGKSSVLDAIWWAICSKNKNAQAQPIRKGQKSALIELDLGKYRVTRAFRTAEDGSVFNTLKVETEEGAKFSSPQAVLDKLVGELSFDPLHFTRIRPEEQFDALRRFVPGFDFDAHAASRKALFDKRTEVNREAKQLRAQVDAIAVPEDLPAEPIDKRELLAKVQAIHEHNAQVDKLTSNRQAVVMARESRQNALAGREQRVAELEAQISRVKEEIATDRKALETLDQTINDFGDIPEHEHPGPMYEAIEVADEVNKEIGRRDRRKELAAAADAAEKAAKDLTATLEKMDETKAAAIANAAMPVPGLSFGDGVVLLDGLPFDQASDAQQLRASIAIAGALNPELRVIRVRDGSLLDDEAMLALADYAKEKDLQIWIERVTNGGPVGFEIEDGMVKVAPVAQAAE